jgi:hypothetical protein
MTVTLLNNHGALPTIFVPTTVQTAIMPIVAIFGSRPTKLTAGPIVVAISVHATIAANADVELLSTRNTWKAYSYRRQRSTS